MIPQVEVIEETKQPFIIDTQEKAAWAMRKLRQHRQKQAENTNTANSLIDALRQDIEGVQAWQKEQNEAIEKDASYFLVGLEAWHRKQYEEDSDIKTIKLPFGQLKIRAQQPEYIRDETKLLAWAKVSRPDDVKTKETADWATIKKSVVVKDGMAVDTTTGEVVDGVQVVEREPKFEVTTE